MDKLIIAYRQQLATWRKLSRQVAELRLSAGDVEDYEYYRGKAAAYDAALMHLEHVFGLDLSAPGSIDVPVKLDVPSAVEIDLL